MDFAFSYLNLSYFFPFLCLFLISNRSEASIHIYNHDYFKEVGTAYLLSGGSEGIVASTTIRKNVRSGVPDGRSFIRFENITFWRSKETSKRHSNKAYRPGLIQVIIFEAADRDNIGGSAYGGQRSICCTPDLAKLEGCRQGEVLRRPSIDPKWPFISNVQFSGKSISTKMKTMEVEISRTGMYNLFFITCDPELWSLKMSGKSIWKNPSGYLPGRMAPLVTFYIFMSVAYLFIGLIWCIEYMRFWKDILQIQNFITLVIGLGLMEMIMWYFEYSNFNRTGMRPLAITTWIVTLGAIRKTVSRLLVLMVSMGYGVVRPTLGGLTSKVLIVGATYFLATEALDIAEDVGTINDLSGRGRLLLVLPDAFLNAFLIVWIFTSLSKTLDNLQSKRSSIKLNIYRKFSNALAVYVIATVALIGYEVYFKATDPFSERWRTAWMITALWEILAFALLCVICFLWPPSQSSQRYAYSEEIGDIDAEETQSLTREGEGDISLVDQEKEEKNVGNTSAFSLENEVEEGKTE